MNDANPPSQEMAIFTEALLRPASERAAYLELVCGNDSALRQRIDALLLANDQVGDFMAQPPMDDPAKLGMNASPLEMPGDRIGRYKLLQQIGEGGCGVVYMAEQEAPVRRRVALKIIKAGMDTKSVIARFEAERQALAMMDHPNIAKVLDAGATESGRPYFVMELVRGVKISDYCDEHSLTTDERLALLIQVCRAVQHAHQKGIIHRDLKPSNILVTTNEAGLASPVVIDFGIAKATTNQRLTDRTLFTAFDMLIGTPAYMSPEQAVLTSVDVDTRTDIYSLGVLLYELLTSVTPFDAGDLLKAGIDEVRRVIREREPVRPSSRLSKMTKDNLTTIAHHRSSEPPKLIRAVHGDLDWIVMKALEKDRTRRYETAYGLALDIERYLSDETISARPPSTLYRFQKTVLRHKLLFSGIAAITLLLATSLVVITASLNKERLARRDADMALRQAESATAKATAETAKSQEVTKFLEDMFLSVGPLVAQGRDTKLLRDILDRSISRIETKLADQPAVQAELKKKIGAVYTQLALYDKAEVLLRDALATERRLFGNQSTQVADALERIGSLEFSRGDVAGAEKAYGEELELRRKLPGGGDPLELARCLKGRAGVYYRQSEFAKAEALVRESLTLRQRVAGKESLEAADSLNGMASILGAQGKRAEEEVMEREIYLLRLKRLGSDNPQTVSGYFNLADTLMEEGKLDQAEFAFRDVLPHARKVHGEEHEEVARCWIALGDVLSRKDQWKEAESTYRNALAILRKTWSDDANDLSTEALRGLSRTLQHQAKLAEAENVGWHVLEVARKRPDPSETPPALERLVQVLMAEKKFEEGNQILAQVIPAGLVPTAQNADLIKVRAAHSGQRGHWSEAATDLAVAQGYRPSDSSLYKMTAATRIALGDVAAYRQVAAAIIANFKDSNTVITVDEMAITCLVHQDSDLDLTAVGQMLARGNREGLQGEPIHRYEEAKALFEYRSRHFDQAAEWAAKSVQSAGSEMQAQGYALLAMAQWQLAQISAAKTSWMAADDRLKHTLPLSGSADLGESWEDWVFAHALMNEATPLLSATSS